MACGVAVLSGPLSVPAYIVLSMVIYKDLSRGTIID